MKIDGQFQTIIKNKKVNSNNPREFNQSTYKQIDNLSNIYYKPLSFGRSLSEHKSWGAVIDPKTKETSFKIFTYPDTKSVNVTVENKNNSNKPKVYELQNKGNGIFETPQKLPAGEIKAGDKYYYTIYKGNGDVDKVKDPYSFRQEKLSGESSVYDHSEYKWHDNSWFDSDKRRISRRADSKNGLQPLETASIYELNTASFTKEGTFNAAKEKLNEIKNAGFNCVEVMPVENTYSFNWGYDGVDKFAPSEHLGGPNGFKEFVDCAHNLGLNVIMDMVPNHLGPDGASLLKTGPYIKGSNCFGEAFNFEGENSEYVKDYIVNAALNWLDNYHCDGLRLDMTKFMESDYTMKQIAAEVNYHKPDAFLIAEDARGAVSNDDEGNYWGNNEEVHDQRVMTPLKSFEYGQDEQSHCNAINKISKHDSSIGRLGYDSEWDFNYFHSLKDILYGNINFDNLEKICLASQGRVKYVMSHDEIGNLDGTRLISKLTGKMLPINENMTLSKNDIDRAEQLSRLYNCPIDSAKETVKSQKSELAVEKLAIMLQTGVLDKYNTENLTSQQTTDTANKLFQEEILSPLGINSSDKINYESVKTAFNKSLNKNKSAMALTYALPGPVMVFQGDDKADLTPFRFFRKFESCENETNLHVEKGYDTGKKALEESTLGSIPYSDEGQKIMNKFSNLIKDLNKLSSENSAMTKGKIIKEDFVKHTDSQVFAFHSKEEEGNNEIFTIVNLADANYPREDATDYYIKFPEGNWVEMLNTDDKKYNGTGAFNNTKVISSDGVNNTPVKLSGLSTCIFKKINN